MGKDAKPLFPRLLTGQNDTRVEEGQELPRWPVVSNTRFKTGAPTRRPGMKRLAVCGTDATSLDFTAGTSDYIEIPSHSVHALIAPFSLETLLNPDSVTGTQAPVGFLHATDHPFNIEMDGDDLVCILTDSGGTSYTLTASNVLANGTSTYARVTVDDDGLASLYIDDATTASDTETLSSTTLIAPGGNLCLGRRNDGSYFDGQLDYLRAMRYVVPDASMAFTRWPTPRAPYMVFDYGGELDTNNWVIDRSPYENHGEKKGSTSTGTTLSVNPAPVGLLRSRRDKDNKTRLLVVAGGRVYNAEV